MLRLSAVLFALMLSPSLAHASEPSGAGDKEAARSLFVEGAALASEMRWGEALARFEQSEKAHAHAGTTYNIGICQRALGRYTLAQKSFRRALAEHARGGEQALAAETVANVEAYLSEIDQVLATLEVRLAPANAAVSVDGRPLEIASKRDPVKLVAGTLPPGRGRPPPAAAFELVIDPGPHVFVVSRKGYADVVVRKDVLPKSRERLDLVMARLPATLHVAATERSAAVAVDAVDVGLAPVTLARPAGRYRVRVQKEGFEPYETTVALRAAERVDLKANLTPEAFGIHEQWWFWLSIGSAVATTAVVTYAVTRPEPERPALDGGGLGWAIRVP